MSYLRCVICAKLIHCICRYDPYIRVKNKICEGRSEYPKGIFNYQEQLLHICSKECEIKQNNKV